MRGFKNGFARFMQRSLPALAIVAAPVPALAQNLVVNGGFETGDFTGWTAPSESYPEKVGSTYAAGGTYAGEIAGYSYNPDTLTQQITTGAGQTYHIQFDYLWDITGGGTLNSLALDWNGDQVFFQQNVVDNSYVWHHFSGLVTGTGSDQLRFAAANDPGYVWVDNVSLSAAPEPAAWAMMVGGFGLIGAALRGRRRIRALA